MKLSYVNDRTDTRIGRSYLDTQVSGSYSELPIRCRVREIGTGYGRVNKDSTSCTGDLRRNNPRKIHAVVNSGDATLLCFTFSRLALSNQS
jgi:hypothetical protein